MVRIELFAKEGLQVVGTADIVPTDLPSSFRDLEAGIVHKVWGWRGRSPGTVGRSRGLLEAAGRPGMPRTGQG